MAQIKKLSDGKYLVRVSQGTGKSRQYINKVIRGQKKDAIAFAREKESLLDRGYTPEEITFTFETLFEKWIKASEKRVSPRTLSGYEQYIRLYALKPLASLKLSEIKAHHIQDIFDAMHGQGFAGTTVHNLKAALNACFSYAVKKEYRETNPCRACDLPSKGEKVREVLDFDEAREFITLCKDAPHGLVFEFALETGMRPEEYLGLRWRDVDFQRNTVSVIQVVCFNRRGGGFYFREPKTKKSRRLIPISEALRDRLMEHRRLQNEHRLQLKVGYAPLDLVFANEVGNPFPLNNLSRRYFKPILKKLGKEGFTLYGLRHTCATLLLLSGENPKVVSERLGHSTVTLTLDVYSHVLPTMQANATSTLDNVLRFRKA